MNPFSSHSYYGLKDLDQIYGNVDTPKKLNSLAEFIDNNGGSLAKVFNTEKKTTGVFNEYGLNMKELASAKDRKAANRTIMDKLADSEFAQKMIDAIKPEKEGHASKMLKRARSLNSMVSCAATFFLVPAFLGVVLPRMVYGMTAKKQKALHAQSGNAQPAQQAAPQVDNNNQNKLATASVESNVNQTFQQLKH